MSFLIGLLNVIAILAIVYYWFKYLPESSINGVFIYALAFKIAAGLSLGFIYYYHYNGGDTLSYFHDAEILANIAYKSPLSYINVWTGTAIENLRYADQPRALLMAKLASLPAIVTCNNYWISNIYFSLFSFFGLWKLTTLLASIRPTFKYPAVISFLFYPSAVFWSSGLLKEPVIMGCLSLCLAIYLPYVIENKPIALKYILLSLLLLFIIWQLKFYYAAVFIPLLFVCIIVTYLKNLSSYFKNSRKLQLIATILLPLILYLPLSLLNPLLNFQNILTEIVNNHNWYLINGILPEEGYIHFIDLKPGFLSIIKNFPIALFSGLFRPLFFEVNNLLQVVAGLENTLLLLLFVAALYKIKKLKNSRFLYVFSVTALYIIILATFLAFSAPNFGSLMRYKVAFLPFMAFLILIDNPMIHLPKGLQKKRNE